MTNREWLNSLSDNELAKTWRTEGKQISKCDLCINSRAIISENGRHYICCLSEKKAMECIMNYYSRFVFADVTRFSNCDADMRKEENET